MENATSQTPGSEALQRLGAVLIQRLGECWVSDTRPGDRAVTLVHTVTDHRLGADPYEGRIILQAWTKGTTAVTPTASYTPDMTGHEGLAHWLEAGDLTTASTGMAAEAHRLLAQLPA